MMAVMEHDGGCGGGGGGGAVVMVVQVYDRLKPFIQVDVDDGDNGI